MALGWGSSGYHAGYHPEGDALFTRMLRRPPGHRQGWGHRDSSAMVTFILLPSLAKHRVLAPWVGEDTLCQGGAGCLPIPTGMKPVAKP